MLSIIIPAYNEESYLPKLLNCIKEQSYTDYEIIVADSNSKDKTRQIAKGYGCRIVKGGFPAFGRNNGVRAAKGSILLFLDADVQFNRYFFEDAISEFKSRNLDIGSCFILPLSDNILDKFFFAIFNIWIFSTQLIYSNASGSNIFCKKWLHEKVGGFDESLKLSEDMDYAKRCGKFGRFRILKSAKCYVAMRRFEKEGRLKVGLKLLLSAFYRILFGEIKRDIFRYDLRYRK